MLFEAAVQMVGTKDYVYGIEGRIAGDLHVSAGMAGDDSTAHSFASKYEPAAKTIVTGVGNAGQAIGATASKLLATAVDLLAADARAAGRIAPHAETQGFAAPPLPDREPQHAAAALPMVRRVPGQVRMSTPIRETRSTRMHPFIRRIGLSRTRGRPNWGFDPDRMECRCPAAGSRDLPPCPR